MQEAASDAFGFHKQVIGVQGGSDIAYVAQETQQPICLLGADCWIECNAHGPDENVGIKDLEDYERFLLRLLI